MTRDEILKELATIREMIQDVSQRVDNYVNGRVDESNESIEETQIGLAETFEATVATTDELTNTQVALAEVYEMITGGV